MPARSVRSQHTSEDRPRRVRRSHATAPRPRVPLAELPPLLLAIGQLVNGRDASTEHLRESLGDALRDADAILRRPLTLRDNELAYNEGEEVILRHVEKTAEYRSIAKTIADDAELNDVVVHSAVEGIWLGMALAYRILRDGAR
jgi:hypothetical protein